MVNKYYMPPTYQNLYVTTAEIERIALFNLPFSYMVACTRTAGWELWNGDVLVAGEYHETNGLRLDVDRNLICDSLTGKTPE